ncbi:MULTISPECIES: hypothetical protein [Nocardia]|uniref:Uncharacterized protein n=1 Tax=Nocardia sputorum TaxID=2984338 RepID=A0ABN6TZJ9_9NOCA|nr:hypothetical protein [Nocardia sputorum]BDT96618.1 hypothetical protein IFM12275_65940 [Nocardia sputorum]BDT98368.1 hypothetical protein IFM12276_13970 [Nocardia sputorum]
MDIEDARRYAAAIWRREDMTASERLAAVKADAHARGKEPFDLGRLESLCDTSHEGRMDPTHWRKRKFELMYYSHPEMMTIEDLAEHVMATQGWMW